MPEVLGPTGRPLSEYLPTGLVGPSPPESPGGLCTPSGGYAPYSSSPSPGPAGGTVPGALGQAIGGVNELLGGGVQVFQGVVQGAGQAWGQAMKILFGGP